MLLLTQRIDMPVSRFVLFGKILLVGSIHAFSLIYCSTFARAQPSATVSGYVTDAESGERLIEATVYLPALRRGVATNAYGFYSLSVSPADTLLLLVSYVGYATARDTLTGQQNLRHDVALTPTLLDEVEVVASDEETMRAPPLSVHRIPIQTVHTAPVLGGESDLLKTLQLLPGVKFGNEGSAGLYVRGGSPDQNLILLERGARLQRVAPVRLSVGVQLRCYPLHGTHQGGHSGPLRRTVVLGAQHRYEGGQPQGAAGGVCAESHCRALHLRGANQERHFLVHHFGPPHLARRHRRRSPVSRRPHAGL